MKKTTLSLLCMGMLYLMLTSYSGSHQNMWNYTGSDGGTPGCEGSGCHTSSTTNNVAVSMDITYTDGTPMQNNIYIPGSNYRITLKGYASGGVYPVFGFQFSAAGNNDGSFVTPTGVHSFVISPHQIIQHEYPWSTTGSSNYGEVSFYWKAPPAGSGPVSFYAVFMLANNNQSPLGDVANSIVRTVNEPPTSISDMTNAISVVAFPNPVKSKLGLSIETTHLATWQAAIYNFSGQKLLESSLKLGQGKSTQEIQTTHLQSGMYFLHLSDGQSKKVIPFVKQ